MQTTFNMFDTSKLYFAASTPPAEEWSYDDHSSIRDLPMASKYAPLSNLPTPPLSSEEVDVKPYSDPTHPASMSLDGESVRLGFLIAHQLTSPAAAQYISRLIPQGASRKPLGADHIHVYLHRSGLPEYTIAMAACVLDALSSFFVRTWRKDLTIVTMSQSVRTPATVNSPSGNHSRLAASFGATPRPELIPLAAMSIAKSFLDDKRGDCRWWAEWVAQGEVNTVELSTTVDCMLRDLNYDLMSFTPEIIEDMRLEMFGIDHMSSAGATVKAYGLPTPMPTPLKTCFQEAAYF